VSVAGVSSISSPSWLRVTSALLCASACSATPAANQPDNGLSRPPTDVDSTVLFGTEHPFVIEGGSYRWRWIAACQARADTNGDGLINVTFGRHGDSSGDELLPFLMRAPGPGEPIDEFIAQDPSGRYAGLRQAGRLLVVDMADATRVDLTALGAEALDDNNPTLPHPGLSFSRDGRVAFQRKSADGNEVVVVDLITRGTQVVYRTKSTIWRSVFWAGGAALKVYEMDADTDGNHSIGVPRLQTSLARRGCRGAPTSFSSFGQQGDIPTERIIVIDRSTRSAQPEEHLTYATGCAVDGRRALAASNLGGVLLAAGSRPGIAKTIFGPVAWSGERTAREYCKQARPAAR